MKKSHSLFNRYATVLMLLVGGALIASGALELALNYRDTRAQIDQLQAAEARAAATRIEQYLKMIELQVLDVSSLPWKDAALTLQDRRDEYRRLLKLVPAIAEIRSIDATGRERLKVSRVDIDTIDSGERFERNPVFRNAQERGTYYSATYFKDGSEPYISLGVREDGRRSGAAPAPAALEAGVTLLELNLKFVGDVIADIHVGRAGLAYVADAENHLVAHPQIGYVLKQTDLSRLPQVKMPRAPAPAPGDPSTPNSMVGESLDGAKILTSWAPVTNAGWRVFVEQPMSEAFGPLYASLVRTAVLFFLGVILALGASWALARRLSQPILAVQRGAARIGAGELGTRIEVKTDDEVEALADEFNRMAGQLEDYTTGLERKVAEKTTQLELANRHKSEFLANMSHELRTPLNAVIGFSDVLREEMFGPLNAKQKEYVRDINTSGQHLLSLINDILDLSKIEAGRMELEAAPFSLAAALDNAQTLIRERAARQGQTLVMDVEPDLETVVGDERKVKQVLINLLSNAVKFTPQGGTITVRVRRSGDTAVFNVNDTGPGIAAEDHDRIFDEFQQLKAKDSAKNEGTGLGLALARRMVELHGGTIHVESAPGQGAAFVFTLPNQPWGKS